MDYLEVAKNVLSIEAKALVQASEKLTKDDISKVVEIFERLRTVGGNLVFCGVGKSGIIAKKLAATFSSLGQPSFFLHPVEALHGDLGRLNKSDAIFFISKSGATEEIMRLFPFISAPKSMRVGLLGNIDSSISAKCDINFDCSVPKEACINNMAPTTSSTLAMAMGDALAVVYESIVGLSQEGFAVNHPGGILGKTLLMKVRDLMWPADKCPTLHKGSSLQDVILEMTRVRVGGCAIVDEKMGLQGIVVEGDIRRTFTKSNNGLGTPVEEIMNAAPVTIRSDALAFDAMRLMEERESQIDILPVMDDSKQFLGFIRLHDLLKEGFSI